MSLFDGQILASTISLLLVQILIITCLARILNTLMKPIKQPMVIAEILCGIILGPSVLGFLPGFSNNIFPLQSLPLLNEIAQLGLVLYLFMVGINLNPSEIKKNYKKSLVACCLGFILPFIIAIPLSFLIHHSKYTTVNIVAVILFMCFSLFISALALLGRILAERRLLETQLGVLSLTSSAVDTLFGMILFAVILSIGGGGGKLNPLWAILLCIAHLLVLWFIIKPILEKIGWYVHTTGTMDIKFFFYVCTILFIVSWFTEVIGVSASFGAFEVGLLIPRKGPLVRLLQSKLEDVVVGIFLPIFFTYSGIRTNFQLINDWESILLTLAIIGCGMISKGIGVFIAGRIMKLPFRQSLSFAILMSAKGLIALVMFNIALDAQIITNTLFTMLVAYVLFSCFITTPLLHLSMNQKKTSNILKMKTTYNILVMPLISLFGPPLITIIHSFTNIQNQKIKITILRLLELNDRMSEYMKPLKKKSIKHDEILGPAYERSYLLVIPIELKLYVSTNHPEDMCKNVEEEQADFFLLGYDYTSYGEKMVMKAVTTVQCPIGIYFGINDPGLTVEKILVPFLNPLDLVNSFTSDLIHRFINSNCQIILFHLENQQNKTENSNIEMEQMKAYVELLNSSAQHVSQISLKHCFSNNIMKSIIEEFNNKELKYKLLIMDNKATTKLTNVKQLMEILNYLKARIKYSVLFLVQQMKEDEEKKKIDFSGSINKLRQSFQILRPSKDYLPLKTINSSKNGNDNNSENSDDDDDNNLEKINDDNLETSVKLEEIGFPLRILEPPRLSKSINVSPFPNTSLSINEKEKDRQSISPEVLNTYDNNNK